MPLTSAQRKAAGSLLARAFADNPGMIAVLDRHAPEQRLVALGPVMQTFVAAAERHGYEVQREQRDPGGIPFTMWHMLRPAL